MIDVLTLDKDESIEPGKEFCDLGDACYYGYNDTIQDYDEAFKYYQKAARLGYAEAFLQLGNMCNRGEGHNPDDKRALEYFKEAIRHGNDEGWAEMAEIYNSNEHADNEAKCWNNYFSSKNFLLFSYRRHLHICKYVKIMITQNKLIKYKDKIREVKDETLEVIDYFTKFAEERGAPLSVIQKWKKVFTVVKEL